VLVGGGVTFHLPNKIVHATMRIPPISSLPAGLTAGLEIAARSIQRRLGNVNDSAQEIFFLGDGLQRAAVDRVFDLLQPGAWSPAGLAQISSRALSESLQAARFLTPGPIGYLAWLEMRNKLEVFLTVQNLSSILGLSTDKPQPLPAMVDKAYRLDPFVALWAVEGLGHFYADASWNISGTPKGLLASGQAPLPDKSLLMLHAGMGLSFSYRILGDLVTTSSSSQFTEAVDRFVMLCRENSHAGFMGAAIESMGLVTRDFYPDMVRSISQALQEAAPELVGFFWHGVGRALYFSRAYFFPIVRVPWAAIESEGQTELERLNLMAGLAWAMTLTNMRHPQVLENALQSYVWKSKFEDGFVNGVSSCIVVRTATTPDASFVNEFCGYQSAAEGPERSSNWNNLIAVPCEQALDVYPELRNKHMLDQVFRFSAKLR
jgi:hypothetical protein